ncbi:neuroglobin-like [Paramacrobiotus metropolitanus]|uniref:neuroglobin-like n=1 Tax=Paramacrobiotus metropolitanus TaxID=2943436 RepID=UPI00244610DE|nr:neuroglobin-like [Paramacrobiotus metropolitanus]
MGQNQGRQRPAADRPNRTVAERMNRSISAFSMSSRTRKRSEQVGTQVNENVPPSLSQRQKGIIKETFATVRSAVAEVGVVMFLRLFETHPEVQDIFLPFKGLTSEEMKHSKQLRNHGLRVMGFVEKCVSRIEQPEKLIALCLELGLKHVQYGAPVDYLPLIGPQFIYAIKPIFDSRWTAEIEEAWLGFFAQAIYYMRQTMSPVYPTPTRKGSV